MIGGGNSGPAGHPELQSVQPGALSLPTSGWGCGWRGTPHDIMGVGARQEMREALGLSHHRPALTSSRQGTQQANLFSFLLHLERAIHPPI